MNVWRLDRVQVDRFWLASCLRLASALCLLLLAFAVFWQPLRRAVQPRLTSALQHVPLPEILRPRARGFMVRVVSAPSGATVSIDGAARGSTPLFANVVCEQDEKIEIEIAKPGLPAWRRTVQCRVGGELTVRAELPEK